MSWLWEVRYLVGVKKVLGKSDSHAGTFSFAAILLTTQMALKKALGPAILSAIPILPIFLFQHSMKTKFLRAFNDAALLQTSLLDGWDTTAETGADRREEFRRFLVDAHKAAYVPVCLAGTDTDHFITAEPAVVTPLSYDADQSVTETASDDPYMVPQLDQGPFPKSRDEEDQAPMPIPPPTPIGGGGINRRPPLLQSESSRRRAYSSGAVLMGNSNASFGHRESLSPSDISGSYATSIGPGRGTPRRGSIFMPKNLNTFRDFSDKSE